MARCLRCKAGNEWIEGNVPDRAVDLRANFVVTPFEGLMSLARQEHPEWWRAWEWIEAHADDLRDDITDAQFSDPEAK